MSKDKTLTSDILDKEQEQTLSALLNLIIPASEDGTMPGAATVGFLPYIRNENLLPWIQDTLTNIIEESHGQYNQTFWALSTSDQNKLINTLRQRFPQSFTRLTTHVIQCYYQNDDVLEAVGLPARPPFPNGYRLEAGDLTLLESVYLRGKIYRD